jgi:mannosyltransferase OCH1-like enzyme
MRIKHKPKTKKNKIKKKIVYDNPTTQVIPLHIYQVWHSFNEIPPSVTKSIQLIKDQNPEFEHHFYDEQMCRDFIKENFSSKILDGYDKVVPYALKADLWRYCILYKKGGIYLDSKYYGINHFKFIHLVDKEYFCKDIEHSLHGIYNAILICKPNNPILLKSINQFIKNIDQNYYGPTKLCIGPLMMKSFFTPQQINSVELTHEYVNHTNRFICYKGYRILKYNEDYAKDKLVKKRHWSSYWKTKSMYI